ncbi:MAG: enolase [Planctomycetaceae bacterium]|nr:enolase [Planctomycetaceae bacterium]
MKIIKVDTYLLKLPLTRPVVAAISTGKRGKPCEQIMMPVIHIETDEGFTGLGYAWTIGTGATAMLAALKDDFTPMLIDEDPLDHERLWQKMYWNTQGVGRHGVMIQAASAVDLALWDLKGKATNLPIYKLLGGAQESTIVYGSDGGWLNMEVDEIIEAAENYMDDGMRGIKLKVGHDDPTIDLERVSQIREGLGDEMWIAVDANQKWDFATALEMGRCFEALDCAWFEEPMICEDIEGHGRLAAQLDIPIALGETLGSKYEIHSFLRANAVDVVQPDITRVGGITEFLKIISMCDAANRIVEPHLMMETSVHLACGVAGVSGLEYMPWLTMAFDTPPELVEGRMVPPERPGLGFEIADGIVDKYRVA